MMGFLKKLKFWEKDEDPFASELQPLQAPEYNPQPFHEMPQNPQQLPAHEMGLQHDNMQLSMPQINDIPTRPTVAFNEIKPGMPRGPSELRKDIELISSKLDTLKAMLDNINTRLDHLESIEEKKIKW